MNLPDEQNPNEIPGPKPARRPRKGGRLWLASLIAIGAIAFAVCFWPEPRPADLKDGFAWLTPSDTVKAFGPPGSLTRLKFRVLMWSPRIWKWYTGAKTQVHLTIGFLNAPSDSDLARSGTILANARCFTNAEDGMRSWVLTADQWEQVRRSFDSWTKSSLRLTTMEGMAATMYSGSQGADGATISLSPRLKLKGFDLLLNASYSGPSSATSTPTPIPTPTNSVVQQPGGGAQIVITNLAVTCRAIVPNGGALIVDGRKNLNPATPTNGTYWLIISPVAVDAAGNAKKM